MAEIQSSSTAHLGVQVHIYKITPAVLEAIAKFAEDAYWYADLQDSTEAVEECEKHARVLRDAGLLP